MVTESADLGGVGCVQMRSTNSRYFDCSMFVCRRPTIVVSSVWWGAWKSRGPWPQPSTFYLVGRQDMNDYLLLFIYVRIPPTRCCREFSGHVAYIETYP